MNVRFTGRHVGIAEDDREYARKKAEALSRYQRRLLDLEIRVMMDGAGTKRVELEGDLGSRRVVSLAEAHGFRAAFDTSLEALKRQLLREKEKTVDRRRRAARRGAGGGSR